MAADLTNINISDSYKGLLHANGSALPPLAIQQPLYDGSGQVSSLSLGVAGAGASVSGPLSISGQLSAGSFTYPLSSSTNGYVLTQVNSTTIALTSISDILKSASSSYIADGTYTNVQNITVKNGLITSVQTTTAVRTFFCDLETFNATALSAASGATIKNRGIYPYGTSSGSGGNTYVEGGNPSVFNVRPLLIRTNYLDKVWGAAANNPMYGTPNTGDVAIVIFSDPTVAGYGGDYVTNPQMWGIKYVWKTTEWIWDRYLAAIGPLSKNSIQYYNDTNGFGRTFQVNNQFSINGEGPKFGVLAQYVDTPTVPVPKVPQYLY